MLSWIVGLLCAGVIGALFVLAAPLGPHLIQFIGDTLRAGLG